MEEEEKSNKHMKIVTKYNNEIKLPKNFDLGLKSPSRANLRSMIYRNILDNSQTNRRKYSYSNTSSVNSDINNDNNNAISALKKLQKERLIISRLGFAEKAHELDKEIEIMREKASKLREKEENELLNEMMMILKKKNERKKQRVLDVLNQEKTCLRNTIRMEKQKLIEKQNMEFQNIVESTERKSIGKIKKCDCKLLYLCNHNKTSSWNIRKPKPIVVLYRKNSKRLKQGGRIEDALQIEEKADEIDYNDLIQWKDNIAKSITQTPWGANISIVDRMIEKHKEEMEEMENKHKFQLYCFQEKYVRRVFAMENFFTTEESRLRIKAKRIYEKRLQEKLKSEGLTNDDENNNQKNHEFDDTITFDFNDDEYQFLQYKEEQKIDETNETKKIDETKMDQIVISDKKIIKNKVAFSLDDNIYYVDNEECIDNTPEHSNLTEWYKDTKNPEDYVIETTYKYTQYNIEVDMEVDIDYDNKIITPVLPNTSKPSYNTYQTEKRFYRSLL